MIEPIWIVAFAGHRPSSGLGRSQAELAACRPRIEQTLKQLVAKANTAGGSVELLTSVAAGADIETAEVARDLGIPIHVILPTSVDVFRQNLNGELESYWPRAEQLIDASTDSTRNGSFRFASGSRTSPECFHDANVQMIRSADVAVAIWNKEPAAGLGGTQEFVEEAKRMDIPVAVIDPSRSLEVEHQGDWAQWPLADPVIDKLNKEVFKVAKDKVVSDTVENSDGLNGLFTKLDEAANRFGNRFRGRLRGSVFLHFFAGLLAAFTASWSPYFHEKELHHQAVVAAAAKSEKPADSELSATGDSHAGELKEHKAGDHIHDSHGAKHPYSFWHYLPIALTAIELLLVIVAVIFLLSSHFSHDHHKWRRSRFAAELLRSAEPSAGHLDPLVPLVSRHEPAWHRFAISIGLAKHHRADGTDLTDQKDAYMKNRICDQRDRYFGKMHPSAYRWNWLLSKLGFSMAIAAPVLISIALYLKAGDTDWTHHSPIAPLFVKFFPILLPLIAGVATSFLVTTDVGRRAERYKNLGERLDRIARMIPGVKTQASFNTVVSETEEILLDELIEWYSASQSTGH